MSQSDYQTDHKTNSKPHSQANSKVIRDVVGGICSVLVAHLGLALVWALGAYLVITKLPFFRDSKVDLAAVMVPIGLLGVCQLIYILPLHYYFSHKGRREVCIGILCTALVTLLMGLALGQIKDLGAVMFVAGIASIATAFGLIGVVFVRMRIQPD
jgi:FtsH-binding integral membrane protein